MYVSMPVCDTYFGEKTLQTNRWFLINSNIKVYAVNKMEFKPSGMRQGNPTILRSTSPESKFEKITRWLLSFTAMYITMLRITNIGDAYVIMNIKTPESTVE